MDVVKLLIEHGVDVKSGAGARALVKASASGKLDVVKLLIEQGVDGSSRVWT